MASTADWLAYLRDLGGVASAAAVASALVGAAGRPGPYARIALTVAAASSLAGIGLAAAGHASVPAWSVALAAAAIGAPALDLPFGSGALTLPVGLAGVLTYLLVGGGLPFTSRPTAASADAVALVASAWLLAAASTVAWAPFVRGGPGRSVSVGRGLRLTEQAVAQLARRMQGSALAAQGVALVLLIVVRVQHPAAPAAWLGVGAWALAALLSAVALLRAPGSSFERPGRPVLLLAAAAATVLALRPLGLFAF